MPLNAPNYVKLTTWVQPDEVPRADISEVWIDFANDGPFEITRSDAEVFTKVRRLNANEPLRDAVWKVKETPAEIIEKMQEAGRPLQELIASQQLMIAEMAASDLKLSSPEPPKYEPPTDSLVFKRFAKELFMNRRAAANAEDCISVGRSCAQTIVQLNNDERTREMHILREFSPTIHALTKARLAELES